MSERLTDAEWTDILATLPENPETAAGWELSLVQRTVERILTARMARAWDHGRAAERRDWEFIYDLATPDEDRQPWPNPYRAEGKED